MILYFLKLMTQLDLKELMASFPIWYVHRELNIASCSVSRILIVMHFTESPRRGKCLLSNREGIGFTF